MRGGVNTYGYVSANPLSKIDPYGLAEKCITIAKIPFFDVQVCVDDKNKDGKKRNKQKREKKQLNDICKEYDIKDRNDFGDFLEDWKPDNGYKGGDTLPYDVLRDVAKQYRGY